MHRRSCHGILTSMLALVFFATPVMAQITTGTVTGTVRDEQGGVIPGATVVLISEARGTKSAPAVTNETGNYVFPNVTPDTYTIEVTMDAFKTVRRTGVAVSGGDRVGVPPVTLEPGTHGRNRERRRRSGDGSERRAASDRSPSPATRSSTCPLRTTISPA